MGFSTTAAESAVTIVDISDLTAANAGMEVISQDGMPLQSMPLRARRVIVRLDSFTVVYHSTNLRVRTRTSAHDGSLGYLVFGPRASGLVDGIEVRPGMMVLAGPRAEVGFVVEPGYESVALVVTPDVLENHLNVRRRASDFHWPQGVEVLGADPARARTLFRLGKRLSMAAARKPRDFDPGHQVRDAAQRELLDALLSAVESTAAIDLVGPERTRRAHYQIVTVAEQHALQCAAEHLHVPALCRATGVSERTLEYAFKEIMGLSPVAYLIRLRLHRARAALLAAEPGSTRVSVEALKCGFWHFGEFSRAYKQCFGELPSQTLRSGRVASSVSSITVARH